MFSFARQSCAAIVVALPAVLGLAASAQAATLAGGYNAFVFGDFTAPGSDVEGRVAVGGNMNVGSYTVALHGGPAGGNALVVGGNLTYTGGNVHNGNVVVGGTYTGPGYNIADNGYSVTSGVSPLPVDFAAEQAALQALSAQLAGLATTGTTAKPYSTVDLVGDGASEYQVFDIDGSLLAPGSSNINLLTASIPSDATVILNISGSSGRLSGGIDGFEAIRDRVIFNFYEATDLFIGGVGVQGSILAPYASVSHNWGVVWGQVIVNNWTSSVQVNSVYFTGKLPPPEDDNNIPTGDPEEDPPHIAAQPEPATFALWGLGALAAGAATRRRRHA